MKITRPATTLEARAIATLKEAEDKTPDRVTRKEIRKQRGYIHGRLKSRSEIIALLNKYGASA